MGVNAREISDICSSVRQQNQTHASCPMANLPPATLMRASLLNPRRPAGPPRWAWIWQRIAQKRSMDLRFRIDNVAGIGTLPAPLRFLISGFLAGW